MKSKERTAPIWPLCILVAVSIFLISNEYTFPSSFPAKKLKGSIGFQATHELLFDKVVLINLFDVLRSKIYNPLSIPVHKPMSDSTKLNLA